MALAVLLVVFGMPLWAQEAADVQVTERFEQEPLLTVLTVLEEKYQLLLAYDKSAISDIYITKELRDVELRNALDSLFEGYPIEFQWVGEQRVLLRRERPAEGRLGEAGGQSFQLRGQVLDQADGQPLSFATVLVQAEGQGVATDENGFFDFPLSLSTTEGIELEIRYLGYESTKLSLTKAQLSGEMIEASLNPKPQEIGQVTIMDRLPNMRQERDGSKTTLYANRLSNLPYLSGGFDPFRAAMMLPGISAHNDQSAELRVRGGAGDENMIVLDGIPLYHVDHFYGIFAIVNGNLVEQMDIYKNAFPAEFGGRLSSVVDITTLPIELNKISGGVEVNLFTSSAHIQLPLGKKMGISLGGRTTNANIANSGLLPYSDDEKAFDSIGEETLSRALANRQIDPAFRFNDFNAKWRWQLSGQTQFQASYFRGKDFYEHDYTLFFKQLRRKVIDRRTIRDTFRNTFVDQEDVEWENEGACFQADHQWSSHFRSALSVAYSRYEIDFSKLVGLRRQSLRFPEDNRSFVLRDQRSNSIEGLHLTSRNEYHSPEGHVLAFGYQWVHSSLASNFMTGMQSSFNQDAQSDQHSFFAEISPDWHDDISLTFGIRSTYDRLTDKIYQSPRFRFSYQFDQHLSLKASWAQYNQFIRQANYEDRFGKDFDYWVISDDVSYPVSSSKQWMVGFQLLKGQWKLDVEFYERNTEGVVEQAKSRNAAPNSMEIDQDFELFIGSGRSQGMDVLLEKTSGNYTGWVAYTLSKTTVSFPDILNGKEFPSVDDRRHQLKWINQYRWKRWNFSATYLFSNGRPYTDLTILTDTKDRRDTEPRERISLLADYHRIDVGLGYGFEWGRSKWNLGASVVNLTDRSNVGYRQSYFTFIDEEDSVERINTLSSEVRLLDFTPNISLSVNF